jgi:integrase
LRRGELIALRWRDVDFAGAVIRVHGSYAVDVLTTPKSGRARSVPLAAEVARRLARLAERSYWTGRDDLVFRGEIGGYLDGSALRPRYVAAVDRAGLRRLRFHDLRHTFGTRTIAKADVLRVKAASRQHRVRVPEGRWRAKSLGVLMVDRACHGVHCPQTCSGWIWSRSIRCPVAGTFVGR